MFIHVEPIVFHLLIFLSITNVYLFILFQHIYSDIQEASWPTSHTNADIRRLPDGTTQITSICQCATLKLTSTRQQFSVEFLCKVPRETNQKTLQVKGDADVKPQEIRNVSHNALVRTRTLATNTKEFKSDQCRNNFSEKQLESCRGSPLLSETYNSQSGSLKYQSHSASDQPCDFSHESRSGGCAYVWVVQHYTVDDCPPCWRHPLQMALRIPSGTHLSGQEENPSETKVQYVRIRSTPRNLKGGIWSLFDPCVNAIGWRPYCPSRMEVSYCTFRFGVIIRRNLRTLSLPRDSLRDNQCACVI